MKDILAIARSVTHALVRPSPARDWTITLAVLLLLALVLAGVGTFYFIGIRSGAIIVPQVAEQPPMPGVSRDAMSVVIKVYEERALNYESGNIRAPQVVDPR